MNEEWKDIEGFEGLYQISNFGNVRSLDHIVLKPNTTTPVLYLGKPLKLQVGHRGHLRVTLHNSKYKVTRSVAKLVAYHFVPIPKYLLDQRLSKKNLEVNHIDGNKLNNRSDNLEWVTHKGNMAHASSTGLLSTTIDDQLLERVQQRLQEGYSNVDISKETGIPITTVSNIRHGVSPRYRTDKYTWSKRNKLDRDTIFSIYDEFIYTDKNSSEIGRKYNLSRQFISDLRIGNRCSKLACEYVTSKGLDGYWKGYRHTK